MFIVIERTTKKSGKRHIIEDPGHLRPWLVYLFRNHSEHIRMRDDGELDISEDALKALEDEPELAEVFDDYSSSDDESDHDTEEHEKGRRTKHTSEPMVQEDGVQQPEMTAVESSTHVFSLDKYNSLYLKAKEFMRIKKGGQIEVIEDNTVRSLSHSASVLTSFPYLFCQGQTRGPMDFNDCELSRYLLKKLTLFAHQMSDGRYRYLYEEDDIFMMHSYARLVEQQEHANVGYYLSNHPDAASQPVDVVLSAFQN